MRFELVLTCVCFTLKIGLQYKITTQPSGWGLLSAYVGHHAPHFFGFLGIVAPP